MFVTENLSPFELLSELLCANRATEASTANFAEFKHNADLCPGFTNNILRTLQGYQKHRIDVLDAQGFHDKGVDVAIRVLAVDGTTKVGLQIKSYDEFAKWKAGRDPGFISRLRNQYTQARHEAGADYLYFVFCTDADEHREQLRSIASVFMDYPDVKIIDPQAAWTFFRMNDIDIDVEITRILCAGDFLLREGKRQLATLPTGGPSAVLHLVFRALAGDTAMTHDMYVSELIRHVEDGDLEEARLLMEAFEGILVEEIDIQNYRIVPNAYPTVCALYYDQLARYGGSASGAAARTSRLLLS
ncbi:hypothetical protein [Sphingomonas sp. PB4P5]|uniref:hypothetical protein n=1 Tax=Parasphingomonas puruogangriensis TaxID=3096155 RepID=UPI002FC83A23